MQSKRSAMNTDRVTLEVLRSYFVAIAEGMAHTLERTAHTTFVKETADFATGLATPSGEFFGYPRNLGVTSFVGIDLAHTLEAFDDYEAGDVVITNDPYNSSGLATHLPDIHMLKPIFCNGELLCVAWCFIHCSDVGGLVPASISPDAQDIYQEGFRLPPRKLYASGRLDVQLRELILANTRTPSENWGDFKAMIASLSIAERRVEELAEKIGVEAFRDGMVDILTWSESQTREVVGSIADGEYSFTDYLDSDSDGTPIRLAVTLRVDGSEIELDYTDSDPQVDAALNLPAFGQRHPFVLQGLINFILSVAPHTPVTAGLLRPFTVVALDGSVVRPEFPAAVGVRYATVVRLYNVVLGALAQAVPGKVPAAGAGQAAMVVLSAPRSDGPGRDVQVLQPMFGGGGATPRSDGVAGNDSAAGFLRTTPIESIEQHLPVLVRRYDLRPDSEGPGQFRGGFGTHLEFEILRANSIVTARGMERCRFEPWGLLGGQAAGTTTATVLSPSGEETNLGRIDVLHLEPGDVVSILACGGGGYGDPFERDPEAVLADVNAGLISKDAARERYGVVIMDTGVSGRETERQRTSRAKPSESSIDLGPARQKYEAMMSPAASAALVSELYGLPRDLRGFVKREVHRALERNGAGVRDEAGMQELVSAIVARASRGGADQQRVPTGRVDGGE